MVRDPYSCICLFFSLLTCSLAHSSFLSLSLSLSLDGHYLNLPVLDSGMVVGMVDVLKLTYATLELASTGYPLMSKPRETYPFIVDPWHGRK